VLIVVFCAVAVSRARTYVHCAILTAVVVPVSVAKVCLFVRLLWCQQRLL